MLERVKAITFRADIVVATTTDAYDDTIVELCQRSETECFRGHPTDLLDRHYQVAKAKQADVVVKIPSDCPLIDPQVIDRILQAYVAQKDDCDFISNLHPATYPDGNDVEVMRFEVLEEAWKEASLEMERQHTTPFIWERPERYRLKNVAWETGKNLSMSHRFTIDYQEDYEFIKRVYEGCYGPETPIFSLEHILEFLDQHPDIYQINARYAGVNWYRNHLNELKTISSNQTRTI
jgi:spore coat polysaccharide biosynthesis protein SpsF